MYKWLMSILFFGACTFGLIYLAVTFQPEKSEEDLAAADGMKTLKITASNFQFDQAEYKVTKGDTLKVILSNKEGKHGIEIVGLDVTLSGATTSKEVTFDKPGTYDIVCSVPCGAGHVQMKTKLVVA
ncbi:cupredoxin domain-containing protein [Paenibacillus koleovorans]|uniref:cupredoxin domain-containing protein n=1 Tax=Paenibacillus koleovorans TaxID=121608 RepID=UPI000FDC1C05|nr:cupredoxin domain-containing protein [Paenibacillus koleovorans]